MAMYSVEVNAHEFWLHTAVSRLMQNAFEYADALQNGDEKKALASGKEESEEKQEDLESKTEPAHEPASEELKSKSKIDNPHRPYLGLATFRMCVLADELLESFFETDFTNSWKLSADLAPSPTSTASKAPSNLLTDLVPEAINQKADEFFSGLKNRFLTEDNKNMFYKFADEVGKKLDIPNVDQRLPSIGKLDSTAAMSPVRDRESILPTNMISNLFGGGKPNLRSNNSSPLATVRHQDITAKPLGETEGLVSPSPLSHAAMRSPPVEMRKQKGPEDDQEDDETSNHRSKSKNRQSLLPPPPPLIQRAQSMLVDRPQFAIDDPVEEGEEEDEILESLESDEKKQEMMKAKKGGEEVKDEEEDLMAEVDQFLANGGEEGLGEEEEGEGGLDDDDELEEAQKLVS